MIENYRKMVIPPTQNRDFTRKTRDLTNQNGDSSYVLKKCETGDLTKNMII